MMACCGQPAGRNQPAVPHASEVGPMASTLSHTPSEAPAGLRVTKKPSLPRRAWRAFTRFLIAFCIGVAATLTWQSHGDAAKQIMASWAAQLGRSEAWRSYGEPAKQIFANWLSQLGATNRAPDTPRSRPN